MGDDVPVGVVADGVAPELVLEPAALDRAGHRLDELPDTYGAAVNAQIGADVA